MGEICATFSKPFGPANLTLVLLLLASTPLGAVASEPRDAFTLWQQGALRGANVMRAQCTVEDLRVLRSWGANLAEIPV